MSERQLYRLRAPSSGREVLLAAEPGKVYTDHDTGEPLEVVGKVLPLHPSKSSLPWAVETLRFCNWCDQPAQKDLNDCPTCGRRMAALPALRGGRMRLRRRGSSPYPSSCSRSPSPAAAATTVAVQEVPGDPVDLSVPGSAEALAAAAATPTPTPHRRRPPDAGRRRPAQATPDARHRPGTDADDRHDRSRTPTSGGTEAPDGERLADDRQASARGQRRRAVRGLLRREPWRLLIRPDAPR